MNAPVKANDNKSRKIKSCCDFYGNVTASGVLMDSFFFDYGDSIYLYFTIEKRKNMCHVFPFY